ncbi:hypothetical protein PoB_001645700 [Plakobranchus ocellatus]|uniref:Uncharacterized protein n=1 Tax=Plakobranchus ocellatus TaxID=259542 RepID=A0AAV3Z606_9GAST|nr:hypothetical protein PoB_001645700 [Plakobranchus ocellatus]
MPVNVCSRQGTYRSCGSDCGGVDADAAIVVGGVGEFESLNSSSANGGSRSIHNKVVSGFRPSVRPSGGGARNLETEGSPADLRPDSLATVPPKTSLLPPRR